MKIFCNECFKDVDTHFTDGGKTWFSSYHCKECEGEVAREKDGRFVIWVNGNFEERTKPIEQKEKLK